MIRMIASDLDGTLLRKDWSISEYTIKIIKEAQASGIRWVTVTAAPVVCISVPFGIGTFS